MTIKQAACFTLGPACSALPSRESSPPTPDVTFQAAIMCTSHLNVQCTTCCLARNLCNTHLHNVWSSHGLALVVLFAEQGDDGLGKIDLLLLGKCGPHNGKHQNPQVVCDIGINLKQSTWHRNAQALSIEHRQKPRAASSWATGRQHATQ